MQTLSQTEQFDQGLYYLLFSQHILGTSYGSNFMISMVSSLEIWTHKVTRNMFVKLCLSIQKAKVGKRHNSDKMLQALKRLILKKGIIWTKSYKILPNINQAIYKMIPDGLQNSIRIAQGVLKIFCLQFFLC